MKYVFIVFAVIVLVGCSSLLPHGEQKVVSRWKDFEEAKSSYNRIVPYQTSLEELRDLGFAPESQANVHILNHADIAKRFIPISLNDKTGLPKGLRECLSHGDECYGYEVERTEKHSQRYGNFLADFLNFKRKTKIRGWEFNALIVVIDKVVVYKLWSGTPDIHEYRDRTNPLGPLQGIGPALVPRPEL